MSQAAAKLDLGEPAPESLARSAQEGDVSAFESLVGLYGPRLLRYVRQRVGNVHTAEDLVQDTFLKAFGALASYDSSRSLTTWLFTIATRVAISHGRRKKEIPVAEPDDLRIVADAGRPDESILRAEEHKNIWDQARRVLGETQFAAVWLKYAEDMPVRQIADVMGMSESNIKVLLHRGRNKLSQCIETDYRPVGPAPAKTGSQEVKYVI